MIALEEHFSLDNSLGFLAARFTFRLKVELLRAFRAAGHDVTPDQWVVLNRLWEGEGLCQREIAHRTFKDRPNVTRILDGMEKKGLIRRSPDETDRRRYRVFLTARGKGLQAELIALAKGVLDRATRGIDPETIEYLKALLHQMNSNLIENRGEEG